MKEFLKYFGIATSVFAAALFLVYMLFKAPTVVFRSVGPQIILCMDGDKQTFYAGQVWVSEIRPSVWEVRYPDGSVKIISGKCSVKDIKVK